MYGKMKLMAVALGSLALLGGCHNPATFPVLITPPANAKDIQTSSAQDGSSYETSFWVQTEPGSYLVADRMQDQLAQAGYKPCGASNERWERLRRAQGTKSFEEIRLLRFFRGHTAEQLGVIHATQQCGIDKSKCRQRFLVRQIDVRRANVDQGDKYIQEICR